MADAPFPDPPAFDGISAKGAPCSGLRQTNRAPRDDWNESAWSEQIHLPVKRGVITKNAPVADASFLRPGFAIIAFLSEVQDRAGYYSTETINTQLIIAFCHGITRDRGVDKKELDLLDLLNIWVEKFGEGSSEEWNALQKNVRALLGKADFLSEEAERIRLLILDYIGVPSGFL